MYRTASIAAYDVMGDIVIAAIVTTYEDMPGTAPSRVIRASTQVRGTGEDQDLRWLQDALVALAETL